MLNKFLFLIVGLASPLLLWPIEFLLPFPHIIEELLKFFGLLWLSKTEFETKPIFSKKGLILGFLFATLFTFTESVLYIMNLSLLNQFHLFPKRLLYTGLLHVTTTLLILIGIQRNWYVKVLTIALAISIHYLYNNLITSFL